MARASKAAEIGFGGSGRNVGLVNAGLWVMPDDVAAAARARRHGERLLRRSATRRASSSTSSSGTRSPASRERQGTLHCAVGAAGPRRDRGAGAAMAGARRAGAPARCRSSGPRASGARAYAGALLDRRAGTIQPLAYVRGSAAAALAAGARVFTDAPGHGGGTEWRPVVLQIATGGGTVTAERVIVATNAYTQAAPWGRDRARARAAALFPVRDRAARPQPPRHGPAGTARGVGHARRS